MKRPLNLDKINKKINDIETSITRLSEFKNVPLSEFLDNRDMQDIASFRLIVATEAAIDICLHLVSKIFKSVPEDYAGCFRLLGEKGLITQDLSQNLVKMARFRNLLVHQYWDIDYSQVYSLITGAALDDLSSFTREVRNICKNAVM